MSYCDAAQLCMHLFITVEGVPKSLLPLTKIKLADAFAELTSTGWVKRNELDINAGLFGASFHEVTDRGHWVEVMASMLKIGPRVLDRPRGIDLATEVGFPRGAQYE